MEYFAKVETKPIDDLSWNIPEQKQGTVNIIGGNSQNFKSEIKIAEFLSAKFPIANVNLILPDALKKQLPPLPNFIFLPSTDSGSFDESQAIIDVFNATDFNLVLGDFSKNSITKNAIKSAYQSSEKMTIITRDAVEIITDTQPEKLLMNENLIIMATMPQLIKLFRAAYYPKMLTLSQSLMQVAEALHKFTLSYPVSIITLHNEQIILATNGNVAAVPLAKTSYTPLSFWQGESAAKITAMNLYNPNNFIKATLTAIFS